MLWVAIHGLANGEDLDETILNRPLFELKERTDYLYQQISSYAGVSPFETVLIPDLAVDPITGLRLGDIVYIDTDTRKLTKALATIDLFNNIFQAADKASIALGMVTYLNPLENPTVGTVAILGKVALSDSNEGSWLATRLLETGETFRCGPYYLSSVEAGKITASPKGPAIYIGYFLNQVANPTLLDYAIISTQYKDVATAHNHRAIAMASQPAGTQQYVADPITGTHSIYGFITEHDKDTVNDGVASAVGTTILTTTDTFTASDPNLLGLTLYNVTKGTSSIITGNGTHTITTNTDLVWEVGNSYKIGMRCRLVVKGNWTSINPVQYIITLNGDGAGTTPVDFDSAYIYWESSDPDEVVDNGASPQRSQIRSYESLVNIGTKGLTVCLENILGADWNKIEIGSEDRRQWVITVPDQIKGWLATRERKYFTSHFSGTDQKYSFILFGGPHSSTDSRLLDTLTIKASHLYRITYAATIPVVGDLVTIAVDANPVNNKIFEFDDGSSVSGNIKVTIVAGDAGLTFRNLVDAIIDQEITGVSVAISTINTHVLIGTTDTGSVVTTQFIPGGTVPAAVELVTAGTKDIGGTNGLMVYDKDNVALVPAVSYWANVDFWEPVLLTNNLYIMAIPYDATGSAYVATEINNSDYWDCAIVDEAPGAKFIYNIYTHQEFLQTYPPIPIVAGALVLNGVELDSSTLFEIDPTYHFGTSGVYWMSNKYGYVPWPADWQSINAPGSAENRQNMVYHNVRMAIGDTGIVSSLQPAPGSPIRVLKCGTADDGTVGNLMLDLDLQLTELSSNIEGYQVYKGISSNKLLKGPVVSQIVAGPGITITSPPGVPQGRGKVTVSLSSGAGLSGLFDNISLENAKQEKIGMFPYVRLLGWTIGAANINTGFTCNFKVPHTIQGNYRVLVYLTMFGETTIPKPVGTTPKVKYAGLEFSYSVLHDYATPSGANPYDNLVNGIIVPARVSHINVPIGLDADDPIYTAYDPIIIHNNVNEPVQQTKRIMYLLGNPFPQVVIEGGVQIGDLQNGAVIDPSNAYVTAGSLVAIRVKRAAADEVATEYTANLGFINMTWQLI